MSPGLLAEFYAALSQSLPQQKAASFRKVAGSLIQVAAPAAKLLPYLGEVLADGAREVGELLTLPPPWQEAFKKASTELKQIAVPVLVVVDDVDRLQTDELLALLKVVRLLGRFPGVQYLLAYDEQTLFRSLETASLVGTDNRAAERFMEKIVQYPLLVPPLLGHQSMTRLEQGITRTLAAAGRQDIDPSRLSRVAHVLYTQFATPRAIDRFLAQLRHHLPMVAQDEIDDVDVILLTALRSAFPTVHGALPRWRSILLTGNTGEVTWNSEERRPEHEPADWTPLLSLAPLSDRADLRELMIALFPKLEQSNIISRSGQNGQCRICDEDYFERYFAMRIPANDVSDVRVRDAVGQAVLGDASQLRTLLLCTEDRRGYLAVSKAVQIALPVPVDDRLELLGVLAGLVDEVDDSFVGWSNTYERVLWWMSEILLGFGGALSGPDILATLTAASLRTKLNLWWQSIRRLESLTATPSWVGEVNDELTRESIEHSMQHLIHGVDAPLGDPGDWYIHFAWEQGGADELRARIVTALDEGSVSIGDLAARMVSTHVFMGVPGATYKLSEFKHDLWSRVAPDRDDPWYEAPLDTSIDEHDISWSNRRRYAQGRATRPQPERTGSSSGPADA